MNQHSKLQIKIRYELKFVVKRDKYVTMIKTTFINDYKYTLTVV